jgi:hypothetical protein
MLLCLGLGLALGSLAMIGCSKEPSASNHQNYAVLSTTVPSSMWIPVLRDGKTGFRTPDGTIVVRPAFEGVLPFRNGRGGVKRQGRWYAIDDQGHFLSAKGFDSMRPYQESFAIVGTENDGVTKYGYLDESGKIAIDIQYDNAWDFSEGYALASSGEKYFFLSPTGKVMATFDEALPLHEGMAAIRSGRNWGYVNPRFKVVIPPEFSEAGSFSENAAAVVINGLLGYIDMEGFMKIKPQYVSGYNFVDGLAAVSNGHGWFLINTKNIPMTPMMNENMIFANGFAERVDNIGWFSKGKSNPYHLQP